MQTLSHIPLTLIPLYIGWTGETWVSNLFLLTIFWTYILVTAYLGVRFNALALDDEEVKPWGRSLHYQMAFLGIIYNLVYMNLAFRGIENAMLYLFAITTFYSAAVINAYHYLKWLAPVFVLFTMVPQCIYYLVVGVERGVLLAFIIACFITFVLPVGFNLHRNAMNTLTLNYLLRDEKERAESATKLKDKFVSLVSHDLRGPISSMHGLMQLSLAKGATQDVILKSAKLSSDTLKGLLSMIQKLLDIGRLQTGVISLEKQFFDASLLVVEKIAKLKLIADNKEIQIVNNIPKNARLFGDSTLIGEVILNLIGNSIKFTPAGGTITLSMPERRMITVSDTGEGISPGILPNIFKYEVKTIGIGTAGETGTGLGLPLCLDIMKAHDGDMRVETSESGSTFYAILPKEKGVVLLVDDQEVHRAIMKEQILAASDVDFVEAENGREALDRLKEAKPILVITDISMHEMDGFELLREIRDIWSPEELPVIVGTALSSSSPSEGESIDTKTKAFNYGANDFIIKPIIPDEFIPRVKRYLP